MSWRDLWRTHPQRGGSILPALVLSASIVAFSWMAMMVVHEFGHMVHAWASGGSVHRVILHPLAISRTDVSPNPHPHFVVWGGPLWGELVPLAAWWLASKRRLATAHLVAFFAGFCLMANGAYLAAGAWWPVGDARDMLNYGTPRWLLILFGLCTIPWGLRLWHGLGRHFGLGRESYPVRWTTALSLVGVSLLLAVLEVVFSDRI